MQMVGDGSLHGSLQHQAQVMGVADRVGFMGYSANIAGLLANATLHGWCP
jgi:hypothetical protein